MVCLIMIITVDRLFCVFRIWSQSGSEHTR